MALGWTDLLRFPEGASLRVELGLAGALREAITSASAEACGWIDALDGATLHVRRLTHDACELQLDAPCGAARLWAVRDPEDGSHRLGAILALRSAEEGRVASHELASAAVALQSGGHSDAYVARDTGSGRRPLLRLHYEADGAASVWLFGIVFARRVPPALRALVPAQITVARLVPLPA
jgi:hypothetical protein